MDARELLELINFFIIVLKFIYYLQETEKQQDFYVNLIFILFVLIVLEWPFLKYIWGIAGVYNFWKPRDCVVIKILLIKNYITGSRSF